jgi:hypothetical protein
MGLPEEIREAHSRSRFLLPSVRADQITLHLHSRAEVGHLIKINKRLVFYYLIRSTICLWFASDPAVSAGGQIAVSCEHLGEE